jgi:hypothetical protein
MQELILWRMVPRSVALSIFLRLDSSRQ